MMDGDNPIVRLVYVWMAAVAGAITALSLMQWDKMSMREIVLTVFVGTAFAIFAVPYLTVDVLGMNNSTITAACGLTYLGGTAANALIPKIIRKISRYFKLDEESSDA